MVCTAGTLIVNRSAPNFPLLNSMAKISVLFQSTKLFASFFCKESIMESEKFSIMRTKKNCKVGFVNTFPATAETVREAFFVILCSFSPVALCFFLFFLLFSVLILSVLLRLRASFIASFRWNHAVFAPKSRHHPGHITL